MAASVTNLRRWREERATPRSELLESRDHSPRLVGETRLGSGRWWLDRVVGRKIAWYVEPPQVRTVIVDEDVVRLAFPSMLFGVQRTDAGAFVALHVFATIEDVTPDNLGEQRLWLLPLPNIIGHAAWVCFGQFNGDITSGAVDPIEAFWSSTFSHHQAAVWKKPAMAQWARTTKSGLSVIPAKADATAREALGHLLSVAAMQTSMRGVDETPTSVLQRYVLERWVPPLLFVPFMAIAFCVFGVALSKLF